MTEKEENLAILLDWRNTHMQEHEKIMSKFNENDYSHLKFIQAITRLETKVAMFSGISAVIGTVIGHLLSLFLK